MCATSVSQPSAASRFLGSGTSGGFELALFHPIDTIAKRLMSNKTSTYSFNQIVFKEAAEKTPMQKWGSLFPGVGFGFVYKILQRMYKFGGQPYMFEYIERNHADTITTKTMQQAVSGSIMGIGEVVLLPLDVLKIKSQTAPEVLAGRGVMNLFRTGDHDFIRVYDCS